MTLSLISNFAANAALRNLQMNSGNATSSVAKLSSGSRVTTAADDAASLAIGSRLNTEVKSLGMATQNASQATSMLQIADGTLARVQDIMTRMKALTVQAGSQNLSDTERAMLNTEYQNHLAEIDRMVLDTKFSGKELLFKDYAASDISIGDAGSGSSLMTNFEGDSATQVLNLSVRGWDNRAVSLGGNGSVVATMDLGGTGAIADADNDGQLDNDITVQLTFQGSNTGLSTKQITLDKSLFYSDNPGAGAGANWYTKTGISMSFRNADQVTYGTGVDQYTQDNFDFVLSLDADQFFATAGANMRPFSGAGNGVVASLTANSNTDQAGGFQELDFKIGTGVIDDEDVISLRLSSVTAESLGIANSAVDTAGEADAASQAIDQALDHLVNVRADIGGSMNRLDQASNNIATSMENLEAARSRMLDLDVAAEITYFTSQQILVQSGISTLAQANQLPQNLLRLFA